MQTKNYTKIPKSFPKYVVTTNFCCHHPVHSANSKQSIPHDGVSVRGVHKIEIAE